jgi:hypothetical protein
VRQSVAISVIDAGLAFACALSLMLFGLPVSCSSLRVARTALLFTIAAVCLAALLVLAVPESAFAVLLDLLISMRSSCLPSSVFSRCRVFSLCINGVKTSVLAPLADMMNHKNPAGVSPACLLEPSCCHDALSIAGAGCASAMCIARHWLFSCSGDNPINSVCESEF